MKITRKIGVAAAATLVSAGSLLGISLAQADDPTDAASPDASASGSVTPGSGRGAGGQYGRGAMMAGQAGRLAEELGLDEATVAEAIVAARDATRPERPADGTRPTDADRATHQDAFAQALADELGVDKATVATALDEMRAEAQTNRGGPRR